MNPICSIFASLFCFPGGWQENTALLVIGGGYDLGYINALKTGGTNLIRDYVIDGGSYLGICAGGYFGSSFVEFDKGGPLEVCGKRDLRFYPGWWCFDSSCTNTPRLPNLFRADFFFCDAYSVFLHLPGGCVGPLFPGFAYNTEKGAYAVQVSWDETNNFTTGSVIDTECYFNGGGFFTAPDPSFTGQILARYSGLDDRPIAIVKNTVGRGQVVLSGVHFEYDPSLLDPNDRFLKERGVVPALEKTLNRTQMGLKSVLKHLRILCK